MGTIQATELPIKDSYQVPLRVPPYQRDYAWTPAQGIKDLWEDLTSHVENSPEDEYLLGPIVTTSGNDPEVIDGQQRLMSVFVMQAAFRERLLRLHDQEDHIRALEESLVRYDDDADRSFPTIRHHDPLATDFLHGLALRKRDDAPVSGTSASISSMRLARAYRWFAGRIEALGSDPERVWALVKAIRTQVKYIRIETNDVSQALMVFERANYRGKLLDPSELLKNLIFQHIKTEKFNDVAESWRSIQKEIEPIPSVQMLDFLRWYHLSISDGFYTTRNSFIRLTQNYVKEQKPLEYVSQLASGADLLRAMGVDASLTKGGKRISSLSSIAKLGSRQKQHYPLLMALAPWGENRFPALARGVERLLYVSAVTEYRSQDLERDIRSLTEEARSLDATEEGYRKVAARLDKLCSDIEASQFYRQKFSAISYEDNQSLARYVLLKIHGGIYAVWDNQPEVSADAGAEQYSKAQVEHIWPKSDAESLSSDSDFVHTIGNLTLLSAAINASGGASAATEKIARTYSDEEDKYFIAKNLGRRTVGTKAQHAHRRAIDLVPTGFREWGPEEIQSLAEHYLTLMDKFLPPVLAED